MSIHAPGASYRQGMQSPGNSQTSAMMSADPALEAGRDDNEPR